MRGHEDYSYKYSPHLGSLRANIIAHSKNCNTGIEYYLRYLYAVEVYYGIMNTCRIVTVCIDLNVLSKTLSKSLLGVDAVPIRALWD